MIEATAAPARGRAWPAIVVLIVVAQLVALGLQGFMLQEKQRELWVDLTAGRISIVADEIGGTLDTGFRAGLMLRESHAVRELLPRLAATSSDIERIEVFGLTSGAGEVLYSSDGRRVGGPAETDWLVAVKRERGSWQRQDANDRLIVGQAILDLDGVLVGGYVFVVSGAELARQLEEARRDLWPRLAATLVLSAIALSLLILFAMRLPVKRVPVRTRVVAIALLVSCCASLFVSWQARKLFAERVEPAVTAKAATLANFLRGKAQRALALGIPFEGLVGVEPYFDQLLGRYPELVEVRLEAGDGRAVYVRRKPAGVAGSRAEAAFGPPGVAGVVRVSMDTDAVAARMREIAADMAVVLMVSVIVFNEVLGMVLGRGGIGTAGTGAGRRLGALRLMIFLFILSEELTRSFLPLHVSQLAAGISTASAASAISLPISVYMLCFALATPYAGRWVERYGGARVFAAGGLVSALGFIWAALTSGYWPFIFARCLCAVGYAVATVAAQRQILAETKDGTTARGLALFVGAVGAAAICGSSIGGLLAAKFSSELVFMLSAVACLAALAVLVPSGLGSAHTPTQATDSQLRDLLRLFGNRRMAVLLVCAALPAKLALAGFLFYLAPLALKGEGYSTNDIGRAVMLYFILTTALNPIAARLADRYGWSALLVATGGTIIGLGGLAGLAGGAASVVAGILALGVGTGISAAALQALASDAGKAIPGVAPASVLVALRTFERLGSVVGPLLAGALLAHLAAGGTMAAVGTLVLASTLAFAMLLGRSPRTAQP